MFIMGTNTKAKRPFCIAIAQLPISGDVRQNSQQVQQAMRQAAHGKARLIQFPEGMLSGYAKNPIKNWKEVSWKSLRLELQKIMALAAELKLWVVLGSAHPLTLPHWPHNSLYVISDQGELVTRYDKRILSYTEVTTFYTAGSEPIVFEVDGFRFGCIICVEINFPRRFIEYEELGIDCLLFSSYPVDAIFDTKARVHAAIHNYWVAMSVPTETAAFMRSGLVGPDGYYLNQIETESGIVFGELDPDDPKLDVALNKARPWRRSVWTDPRYNTRALNDPRSVDRLQI